MYFKLSQALFHAHDNLCIPTYDNYYHINKTKLVKRLWILSEINPITDRRFIND